MKVEEHYREAASHALAGFQLIEEGLKSYIDLYHQAVRRLLSEKLTYRYARKDVQDAAYGKLVEVFGKVNGNDELIADLRSLKKIRDDLAHKAFVNLYGTMPEDAELRRRADLYIGVADKIGKLMGRIQREAALMVAVAPEARDLATLIPGR